MSATPNRPSQLFSDSNTRIRNAGIILAVFIVAVIALSFWKPGPMQAITGAVAFLAVCALGYMTWLHVLSNEKLARSHQAILKTLSDDSYAFGMRQEGPNAILWIANLGHAHIMLHTLYFQSGEAQSSAGFTQVVQAGNVVEQNITKQLLELPKGAADIDVWFEFVSASGSAISSVQSYNVLIANGIVCRVRSGSYQPRNVECPTCHENFAMSVTGLARPEDVESRSIEFKGDLVSSCPNHTSQFLLKSNASVGAGASRSAAS